MDRQSSTEVARRFGREFAGELLDLDDEIWHGPIASPYGWHLVFIQERIPGELPALDQVWDQVEREWTVERKQEIKEEQYRLMRAQYHISIED